MQDIPLADHVAIQAVYKSLFFLLLLCQSKHRLLLFYQKAQHLVEFVLLCAFLGAMSALGHPGQSAGDFGGDEGLLVELEFP